MPDNHESEDSAQQPQVLLIAQLRAHLVSGDSFDLLPIKHEKDVKTEVESLIESWSDSGFLVHGRFIYPWHQVRHVEVTQVEDIPAALAQQRLEDLYAADRARTQENFWRTREKSDAKKGGEEPPAGGAHPG